MPTDSSNMLKAIEDFPHQCRTALELAKGMAVSGKISNIIVAGMGGSAVGGDLLRLYMHDSKIPVTTIRDYKLPDYVNESTLVFAVSYSGNTEETLAAYEDAVRKKAKIVAVTSGGRLWEVSKKTIKIPKGLQPRAALGYLFFPVLGVLVNSGIVKENSAEIAEMLDILPQKEEFRSFGEKLAKKIGSRTPLIYASEQFSAVAYRWKTQFNENSKIAAFSHVFSEMNHNEIVGYQSMGKDKFTAIFIRDNLDNERIRKRMDITKEIISQKVEVEEVYTKGTYLLSRLFSGLYYADFASYYLALQNKIDPTPVHVIENLKKKLAE
ncbi:bifunctional phosphoglucose/phosphomannose isomerase [Candidatus Woesearchaeota archaeon]|nr:bifunctional phosphoglucose/phosphomannose isomerase [Candidatus Woesearchaeota archaeon]